MSFALTESEISSLNADQKTAVMESLLIAVLADGKAEKPEVAQFDREVDAIKWGMDRPKLAAEMEAARSRILAIAAKGHAEVLVFIGSVAARLPSEQLREKVFRAMCMIMSTGNLNAGEKTVIHAFAMAFRIPLERLEAIKADVGSHAKS